MVREITNSLDARKLWDETHKEHWRGTADKPYTVQSNDLTKLLRNISSLIDDLNKMEVYARRAGKRSLYHRNCLKLVQQINDAFKFYDQMVFFAKLAF